MKTSRIILSVAVCVPAFVALAIACGGGDGGGTTLKPGSGRTTPSGSQEPAATRNADSDIKSQAQALGVLTTADEDVLQEGKMGVSLATAPSVKSFAETLVADYEAAHSDLQALAKKKNLTAEKTAISDRMKFDSDATLGHYQHLDRGMFDRSFLTRQINLQKSLLGLLDTDIARVVTDPELKTLLATFRTNVEKHRDAAQQIQNSLPIVANDAGATSHPDGGTDGGTSPDAGHDGGGSSIDADADTPVEN